MNTFYNAGNFLVGLCLLASGSYALYLNVPEWWAMLDAMFVSALSVVILVGVLIIGFLTLESRKA